MDDIQNRRRNYFIKKEFQAKFIIKFCMLVIIGTLISGTIIYYTSKPTVTTIFENSRLTIKNTAEYILPAVLLSSVIVIAVVGLATIAVTMFASHKIAGPLYRMEKDIEEVAAGNLAKKFNLRSGDEVKVLAEGLEAMSEALRNDVASLKSLTAEVESAVDKADKHLSKEKIGHIKAILEKFKT